MTFRKRSNAPCDGVVLIIPQIWGQKRVVQNIFNIGPDFIEDEGNRLNDPHFIRVSAVIEKIEVLIDKKLNLIDIPK